MREPSRRELFLQNRLALSSSLLYECTQLISGKANPDLKTLIIECELFFSETRTLLLAEIQEEEAAESPTSAPPAGKSGAVWESDSWTGWQQASSASPADSDSENPPESTPPQDHSSNPSPGGQSREALQDSLISRIRASWNMRHGSISTGSSEPNLENP